MSRIVSKLFMLMLLMGSMQVFAGNNKNPDETVLINQTSVQDAGGFPFKITAPGSYKLIGNLVVPANTTGVLVQSNDVTLDLNGFSIAGGIVCDNGGDNCTPPPTRDTSGVEAVVGVVNGKTANIFGVTIKNGHVRGFTNGVLTFGGIVEEITAQSNLTGIFGFDAVIRKNDASRNNVDGIACNQCVVTENVAAFNQSNNFHLVFGGVFASNTAVARAGLGVNISKDVVSLNNNSCNSTRC